MARKTAKETVRLPSCFKAGRAEAGCDEAGRGCLAGPVYAAAVILPDGYSHPGLNDSEQLTEHQRDELRRVIIHGILHLCGINDKGPGEREIMEEAENRALAMHP